MTHDLSVKIYLIGLVVIPILFAIINRCTLFMTKEDMSGEDAVCILVVVVFFWPLILILATILAIGMGYFYLAFPSKNKKT